MKNLFFTTTFIVTLLWSFALWALPSAEGFHARFDLLRNSEGKLLAITDKSIIHEFSILTYINSLKGELKKEQIRAKEKNYQDEAKSILFEDFNNDKMNHYANKSVNEANQTDNQDSSNMNKSYNTRFPEYMLAALEETNALPIDDIFSNDTFKKVLHLFETKLKELMLQIRLDILSKPDDPTYFYKRNVTYQAVQYGLELARKYLSQIPYLNTASYIIVQVEKLIRERRIYHQNMMIYYLQTFPESELGLTKEEADLVMSSVYESRISWSNYVESRRAQNNWTDYGFDHFYAQGRQASNTLRRHLSRYDVIGKRLNFAFNDVNTKGKNVIINLFDSESIIQWYPAIAFEYERPSFIKRKRELLRLVQIGISFTPTPSWIKDIINTYIDSTYTKQRLTEGSLYGHFEANNMTEMKKLISQQTMNPFENL